MDFIVNVNAEEQSHTIHDKYISRGNINYLDLLVDIMQLETIAPSRHILAEYFFILILINNFDVTKTCSVLCPKAFLKMKTLRR